MEEIKNVMGAMLPVFENWLRNTVRDEMEKTLEAEREKARPERNLTRDEVCNLLHISKPTLWKKTKQGEINAITIGRRVLYAESEVKRYLEEG
ncbi:MAG: helix-turn-helix domain-containing protein [Aeriscardovia sp.]|nr:helix-turn-helix domain-containing protein [Aeriscardovia sp.]